MSEFSWEYVQYSEMKLDPDFSYFDLFKKLKQGESLSQICEGFGTIGIRNIDGTPFLVKTNNDEVNLFKLLETKSTESRK